MKKILLFCAAIMFLSGSIMAQPMELEFNTNVSAGTTIILPLYGITSVTINWDDGNEETINTSGDIEHTYDTEGVYNVTIDGTFSQFGKGWDTYDNADKLTRVIDFGDVGLTSLSGAFRNAENLTEVPDTLPSTIINTSWAFNSASSFNQELDTWDVTNITNMYGMFIDAVIFNGNITNWNVENVTEMTLMFAGAEAFNQNIGDWDVSNVTDMYSMFSRAHSFNQDIGGWDVSSVENMSYMFAYCYVFNQDIGGWDVGEVTTMSGMFHGATNFNQDIGGWDVQNVTAMSSMLRGLSDFNQDIGNWDVSNVEDLSFMFNSTENFNQDIGNWDVSGVKNMKWMFRGAKSFNQDIGSWVVDSVTDMSYMFYNAENFNQDIGGWEVGHVTNMWQMFYGATNFNQDIGGWNVSNVEKMAFMFRNAESFNQDISGWDVGNVNDMGSMFSSAVNFNQDIGNWDMSNVSDVTGMLSGTSLSTAFYNNLLIGWSSQTLQDSLSFHGGNNNEYSPGESADARQAIIDNYGWEIWDGGVTELPAVITADITEIDGSSAISGGEVTSDGGHAITEIGAVWDTTESPALNDNEGYTEDEYIEGTTEFISEISALLPKTLYYVRAYATNSQGTEYGNSYRFTTTAAALTIAGTFTANDKEYDGDTLATIETNNLELNGVLSELNDVSLDSVEIAFVNSDASDDNKEVVIVGAVIMGLDSGCYYLSLTDSPISEAKINPKEIQIEGTFSVSDKEYDGTAEADIIENNLVLKGVIENDSVELVEVVAEFETSEPGENISVSIVDAELEGNDADNYLLSFSDSPKTAADITEGVNSIEDSFNDVKIYPNPFNNYLTIENTDNVTKITLTNILGQVILVKEIDDGIARIKTTNLKNGLYLLSIDFDSGKRETRKIIKH